MPPVSPTTAPASPAPRRAGGEQGPTTAAQQLELARAELRALELRLKPDHPDIGRAKRVIAELEAKAEAEALQQPLSAVSPGAAPNPAADRAAAARAEQMRAEIAEIRARIESGRRESARLEASIADLQGQVQIASVAAVGGD